MRIAVISDDEASISQHFGRAPYYVVLTVEGDKIVDSETRPKAGHHSFAAQEHPKLAPGERHGYDAGSQAKHKSMAETIADCEVLIAGGMGSRAQDLFTEQNIEVVVGVSSDTPERIVTSYLDGSLETGQNVCDH